MYYFAALSMEKGKQLYNLFNKASAISMILALLWLTISTPFVFSAQQDLAEAAAIENPASLPGSEDDSANPFGNTTEEKAPSSTSLSEEYLHDHHANEHFFTETLQHFSNGNDGTYIAFHGELLVPPPNAA